MPEGHTIHRLARDHQKLFAGQKMSVSSPQGRFADEAQRIDGQTLKSTEAYGKHLFYLWESGERLHIHLGLYGKFRLHNFPLPEPQGAVRVRMVGDEKGFDLNGPNQCEIISQHAYIDILNRLGEDPLRKDADPSRVWQRIHKSRAALGSLLMNQAVIAGIGNIYRCEILFALGIHPERKGNELTREQFDELWALLQHWFGIGVKYRKIITVDWKQLDKPPGRLTQEERLNIYKHQHCPNCGSDIQQWELAARKIYACVTCQQ